MSLVVNLIVTFLYQANQYIVAPTSAEYAHRLGMTAAMSGLIIGLSPAAALVSSLLYSQWTNTSFRQPLLLCVVCAVSGNILYGAALQHNSVLMMVIGRLLVGFGCPRVISRRYIADHVSLGDRLIASGQFVSAGALGLVFGPLMASLIRRCGLSFQWTWPIVGTVLRYETVTAPGWIMAVLWLLSLIAILTGFEEPVLIEATSNSTEASPADDLHLKSAFPSMTELIQEAREPWMTEMVQRRSSINLLSSGRDDERSSLLAKPSHPSMPPAPRVQDDGHFADPSQHVLRQVQGLQQMHMRSNYGARDSVQVNPSSTMPSRSASFAKVDTTEDSSARSPVSMFQCWCAWMTFISVEVHVVLFVYFANKVGQELVISSMPLLLRTCFAWEDEAAGYFMALVGALVVPTNILIHRMGGEAEERDSLLALTYWSILFAALVCHFTSAVWGGYTLLQYLLGTAGLFILLNAIEGVVMSLLSKLIAPELARSTCNSGLLATEAGTIGRVVGDALITFFGNAKHGADLTTVVASTSSVAVAISSDSTQVVNHLFFPVLGMLLLTVGLINAAYDRLID